MKGIIEAWYFAEKQTGFFRSQGWGNSGCEGGGNTWQSSVDLPKDEGSGVPFFSKEVPFFSLLSYSILKPEEQRRGLMGNPDVVL